jgi:hypothetical protein
MVDKLAITKFSILLLSRLSSTFLDNIINKADDVSMVQAKNIIAKIIETHLAAA